MIAGQAGNDMIVMQTATRRHARLDRVSHKKKALRIRFLLRRAFGIMSTLTKNQLFLCESVLTLSTAHAVLMTLTLSVVNSTRISWIVTREGKRLARVRCHTMLAVLRMF